MGFAALPREQNPLTIMWDDFENVHAGLRRFLRKRELMTPYLL